MPIASSKNVEQVLILACGTSYYSGSVAKYWLEGIARIPTSVEVASEYRYRDSVPNPKTLVVTISQSGETADTLAALKHARSLGMEHTLTICNVATSAMVRECAMAYVTRAGVEIGVASTKAFTTQLVGLFLLALSLAQVRGRLDDATEAAHLKALRHLPVAVQSVLALEPQVIAWSEEFARKENALFLGRGVHYPVALEGALKLKEISYIHAEAYPAGELKHGPLALVTAQMPVVAIAPNDALLEKLESNLHEVRARGGELFVFRRCRHADRIGRGRARHPHARALRRTLADPARRAAAAAGVPHGRGARHRCRQAAKPGQERDRGVGSLRLVTRWSAARNKVGLGSRLTTASETDVMNLPHRSSDPDPVDPAATPTSDQSIARLVGEVFESAPLEQRGRLLDQLLRPLGVLSLFAVAGGLFARLRLRGGWENFSVRPDDLQTVHAADVIALVDYVQQVSVEAVDGLAQLLAASPLISGSAAALLVTLLVQRARVRRGKA